VLWFCNPNTYGWARRADISVRSNDAVAWATDSITYRFTTRFTGAPLDVDGWVGLENFIA
jgi:hypothetical protein